MAYRRVGRSKLSRDIFRRVLALEPHSGVACADFARSEEILGNGESALRWYWRAIQVEDSRYTKGRALVYLEEMNALIVREGLDGEKFGIDPGLIRHIPVEFRVVLRWDADQSNFDLWVRKPVGWVTWEGAAADAGDVEWWSGNLSQGYGPESWSSRSLLPGAYEIGARFYGDWNSEGKSTATAEVEVIRNFGQKNETRETYTLRVEEKTNPLIVRAKYYPKGWE